MKIPRGYKLCIADVHNLYPSLDPTHLKAKISARIRRHFAGMQATYLIELVGITIDHQVVEWESELCLCTSGLATGVSVATIIANLYLDEYD